MTVPFLDLSAAYDELAGPLVQQLEAVLRGGRYVQGPQCAAFEEEFAAYLGCAGCVGVGNGLDALRLGLAALGIGRGDDVLVPSNTYIATWLAVSAVGATPVPVEPDEETFNMSPAALAAAVTDRAKAVIPVHLYGLPADMGPILEIAARHELAVVEDACQAHGARLGGTRVGGIGTLAAWSFYPAKNLGALGDGGAVTSGNPALLDRVRSLGNYGSSEKYVHAEKGWNSRLDELQAAVLRVKLPVLDRWNARRGEVAGRYLAGIVNDAVSLPAVPAGFETVWHQFVVRTPKRDLLARHLLDHGIESLIHYPVPPHLQQAYSEFAQAGFPVAECLATQVLSLPIGPHMPEEHVERVIAGVNSFDPG